MIDCVEQLDFVDAAAGRRSTPLRACLDIDAGWWPMAGRVRIGAKRSPIRSPSQAASLASALVGREGWKLAGLMAYEAQIAGVGNAPPGRPVRGLALRAMQKLSAGELAGRRAEIVKSVRAVAPLEFVNGGGTGSIETTGRRHPLEITAGSGLYGPTLFDAYRGFRPRPAAMFALPVVRKPRSGVATVLGGGYLASGAGDGSRLPTPHLPSGLRLDRQEGAREVQTPVLGRAADGLHVGDRVYFRDAKAGEMCERFDRLYLVDRDRVVRKFPPIAANVVASSDRIRPRMDQLGERSDLQSGDGGAAGQQRRSIRGFDACPRARPGGPRCGRMTLLFRSRADGRDVVDARPDEPRPGHRRFLGNRAGTRRDHPCALSTSVFNKKASRFPISETSMSGHLPELWHGNSWNGARLPNLSAGIVRWNSFSRTARPSR